MAAEVYKAYLYCAAKLIRKKRRELSPRTTATE